MKVLFLAIEFPPVNTAGVFRSLKFVKYLPDNDVEPIVLTLAESEALSLYGIQGDPSLLDEVPSSVCVIRISGLPSPKKSGRIRRFLSIYFQIEDRVGSEWRSELLKRLPAIVREHQPQVVYVSLPPFSGGRLAVEISRRYRLPLIVDMRDGWSHWRIGPFGSWLHHRLTYGRERALFAAASAVITVTRQLAAVFTRTHPGLPPDRIQVITNGYDFDLSLPQRIDIAKRSLRDQLLIGYVGSFYYEPEQHAAHFTPWWKKRLHRKLQYSAVKEDWRYRSPLFFLRAMANLFARRPEMRGVVRFEVMGSNPQWLTDMASELGVSDNCVFHPRQSYGSVLAFQSTCDAFLCTSVKVPGGEDYAIASKSFDYLRYAKPILGFVTNGAQREFLANSGMGLLCDPDDVSEGAHVIERVAEGGFALTPNLEYLDGFHRRVLAAELASIIKRVAA